MSVVVRHVATVHEAVRAASTAGGSLTDNDRYIVIGTGVLGILALLVAAVFAREVLRSPDGTPRMKDIAKAVQEGANAFLARQFRTLSVFAVLVFALLFLLPAEGGFTVKLGRSLFFLLGAVFSALVGFIGMTLATRANLRVAAAAQDSGPKRAVRIAFRSGGVVGMFTVGLGLLGASLVTLIYNNHAPIVLEGFGFGGALLAMFMRVGGGIFTKAADVGADLVGKVEQGIPEDDPRNAATIADNVGDNVGDCAGMAADLFESYAVTLVAALILGQQAFGGKGLVFPLIIPAIGVITAVIGILSVRPRPSDRNAISAINRGFFVSAIVSAGGTVIASFVFLPAHYRDFGVASIARVGGDPRLFAWLAVLVGIVLAAVIQLLTGYFTETNRRPVREIGEASLTGPATVILGGISVGLESAVYSGLLIGLAVYGAFLLGNGSVLLALFYVALAGTGLLTTVGVIISMDTFGPISDNAQGIAEMSGEIDEAGARTLTELDAVGNTTKAITKGIAIATAVLAATALFGSYGEAVLTQQDKEGIGVGGGLGAFSLAVNKPNVLFGVIIGAAVVFFFSGLAISAVARAAGRVVVEVRKQFHDNPGIMDFSVRPNYAAVVDICTKDSLRELATPGLLAVMAPIATGFFLGYEALGGYLAGAIAAGVLMAVFLSNSGGAWDNAKKLVEDGVHGGKGSPAHEATIIGDTVGDPFKDTAGPALNPLIKVMNLVAVLIAPSVVRYGVASPDRNVAVRVVAGVIALAVILAAVLVSKRRHVDLGGDAGGVATPGEVADPQTDLAALDEPETAPAGQEPVLAGQAVDEPEPANEPEPADEPEPVAAAEPEPVTEPEPVAEPEPVVLEDVAPSAQADDTDLETVAILPPSSGGGELTSVEVGEVEALVTRTPTESLVTAPSADADPAPAEPSVVTRRRRPSKSTAAAGTRSGVDEVEAAPAPDPAAAGPAADPTAPVPDVAAPTPPAKVARKAPVKRAAKATPAPAPTATTGTAAAPAGEVPPAKASRAAKAPGTAAAPRATKATRPAGAPSASSKAVPAAKAAPGAKTTPVAKAAPIKAPVAKAAKSPGAATRVAKATTGAPVAAAKKAARPRRPAGDA